jgi:ATP-dependent RNA helicase DDX5/DBP2
VTVRGSNIPKPVLKFEEAGFHDFMLEALRAAKFEKPTLIQSMAWPIVLSGRDLIGVAETGSGKTISFMLPAMVHLRAQRPLKRGDGPIVLVLAPTRELAVQIDTETKRFASTSKGLVRSVCCYGGQGTKGQQIRALRAGVEIVVATPGRLNDFLNQGIVNLDRVTYLVLDEADRMLDMGFEPQIREIIERIRPDRQTVMFTATWPKDVQQLARDFISEDACQVNVGSLELKANSRVDQRFEFLNNDYEKEAALVRLFREMHMDDGSRVLLFVQRKQAADDLARALQRDGIDALAMHGDKSQPERDRILDEFRRGSHPVLVATDVAARGLDVKNVKYVVNYDMPNNVEDYVHRIGRTARAGAEGVSLSFFTQQNAVLAEDLYNLLRESGAEIPARLHEYVEEARRSRYMKRQRYGQARGYAGRGRGGFGGNRYGSNSGGGRW